MITPAQIANLYAQRRLAAGPERARMAEVQQLYNGDVVVPLPELFDNERAALPNRVRQGLAQIAMRIASSMPNLTCPVVRPGIKKSEQEARLRRQVLLGWWDLSSMATVLRQRARYLQGYGTAPVRLRYAPARRNGEDVWVPRWHPENPLTTFPAPMRDPSSMCPRDCLFESHQTLGWIMEHYPEQAQMLHKTKFTKDDQPDRDATFALVEYVDRDECVLIALGASPEQYTTPAPGSMVVELERYENRADICPVVIPAYISLDRRHGQFDGMFGMYQTEAMLTALSIIATKKGVFQDEWLVAHPNEEPVIVQVPNAFDGTPGVVKGGALVPRGVDPQFQTNITIDRLAEAQMKTSGLASDLQGVASTNVRTGRRGAQLLSAVIDFPIQEAQVLFEQSLAEENRVAIAMAKAYDRGSRRFYTRWRGAKGVVDYKATELFETDENDVSYSLAGADSNGLVIEAGQRIGMGTMSKETFMSIDPMIEDVESEKDRITVESLSAAALSGIQQQASQGAIPPSDLARILELVASDRMELWDAIAQAQQEAQERQAAQVEPTDPAAQPGLAQPGMGAEAGQAIPGPAPSQQGLASLLTSLRRPEMRLSSERPAPVA